MARMQVKVSKVFAAFINKTAKEMGFKAHAEVVEMGDNQYRFSVGDPIDGCHYGDWDWKKSKFRALMITYPYEYYALPKYLTTEELNKEYVRGKINSVEGLKAMLREMIEI